METSEHACLARRWPAVLTVAVTGLVLGGVNSLSNVLGSPYSPHALRPYPGEGVFSLQVVAAVVGTAWAWALVAFALGWWAPTAQRAAATAIAALALASGVYYVSDHALGLNDQLETGELVYWAVTSVGAGSVFGLLGHLARRPRWWSLLPGLAAPGVIVVLSGPTGSDHIQPWPERLAWGMAVLLTIVLTLRWARRQRRRASNSRDAVTRDVTSAQ